MESRVRESGPGRNTAVARVWAPGGRDMVGQGLVGSGIGGGMGGIAVVPVSVPVSVPVPVVVLVPVLSGSGIGGGMGGIAVVPVPVSGSGIGGIAVVLALLLASPVGLSVVVPVVGLSPVLGVVGTTVLASASLVSVLLVPQARVLSVATSRPRRTSAGLLGGGVGVGGTRCFVMRVMGRWRPSAVKGRSVGDVGANARLRAGRAAC